MNENSEKTKQERMVSVCKEEMKKNGEDQTLFINSTT